MLEKQLNTNDAARRALLGSFELEASRRSNKLDLRQCEHAPLRWMQLMSNCHHVTLSIAAPACPTLAHRD